MSFRRIALVVVAALLAVGIHSTLWRPTIPVTWLHTAPEPLDDTDHWFAYERFAYGLFQRVAADHATESFALVPMVTHIQLDAAYAGAAGSTKDELKRELGLIELADALALDEALVWPRPREGALPVSRNLEITLSVPGRADDAYLHVVETKLHASVVRQPASRLDARGTWSFEAELLRGDDRGFALERPSWSQDRWFYEDEHTVRFIERRENGTELVVIAPKDVPVRAVEANLSPRSVYQIKNEREQASGFIALPEVDVTTDIDVAPYMAPFLPRAFGERAGFEEIARGVRLGQLEQRGHVVLKSGGGSPVLAKKGAFKSYVFLVLVEGRVFAIGHVV